MNKNSENKFSEKAKQFWIKLKKNLFFRIGCAVVTAAMIVAYGICVYRNNKFFESYYPDVVQYPMNTRIELGENYLESGKVPGFFMTVTDAYVTDLDSFIKEKNLKREDVLKCFEAGEDKNGDKVYAVPNALVIVTTNIENVDCEQTEEALAATGGVRKGVYLYDIVLCGFDWYTTLEPFVTGMVNEGGYYVADFDPGQSKEMTMVYPVFEKITDWNKATEKGVYLNVTYGPTKIKAMLDLSK